MQCNYNYNMDNLIDVKLEKLFKDFEEYLQSGNSDCAKTILEAIEKRNSSKEFLGSVVSNLRTVLNSLQKDVESNGSALDSNTLAGSCGYIAENQKLRSEITALAHKTKKTGRILGKILKNYTGLEEIISNKEDLSAMLKKVESDKEYIQRKRSILDPESETPKCKPKRETSLVLDTSTIIGSSELEYLRYLETHVYALQFKINSILKVSKLTEEELASIGKEINKNLGLDEAQNVESECFKAFQRQTSEMYFKILERVEEVSQGIPRTRSSLGKVKQYYQNKVNELCFRVSQLENEKNTASSNFSDQISEYRQIIETQEKQLNLLKLHTPILSSKHDSEEIQEIEIMEKNYENLLFINMQLKSDILSIEGELTKQRKQEEEIKELLEKCELLEKVNKELSNKKQDSDDSLDLDCSNIKDTIEIQELRAALRSISERYEQEKETILRDCEESRQDIETQMFRLKNEKAYIEVRFKDMEKFLSDVIREKERQDGLIASLRKDIERIKDLKMIDGSSKAGSRRGSEENMISGSGDFDLTESVDKFAAANGDDSLQDEINEIALEIQQQKLILGSKSDGKELIKDAISALINIQIQLYREIGSDKSESNVCLTELLAEAICGFKARILSLEHQNSEKDNKIEELTKSDRMEVQTEPSPRAFNFSLESSYAIKKQLQLEKSKVYEKKHEIHLHKEQIAFLKQNVRDLQLELDRVSKLDLGHIRDIWIRLNREIPLLHGTAEDLIEVLMKMLGFSHLEIVSSCTERRNKKSKGKFGLFG